MATGDAAAAAGLPVVPSTKDYRLGYDDINAVADALANHQTNGTHDFAKIKGQAQTAQIANLAVTRPKIANGAVDESKIYRTPATTGFGSSATGWTTNIVDWNSYCRRNAVGDIALRLVSKRTGGTITASDASGGVTDTLVFTITNEDLQPLYQWPVSFKYYSAGRGTYEGLATINTGGTVTINSLAPSVDIVKATDDLPTLILAAVYPGKGLS
jgi:hypothetical protein